MIKSCSECRFWFEYPDGRPGGECRRYAPRPNLVTSSRLDECDETGKDPSAFAFWAEVAADDWCGEWEASD